MEQRIRNADSAPGSGNRQRTWHGKAAAEHLAFTVDDIDREYEKVLALGAEIIEPPTKRPWGAVNMSFYDPDNNMVFFRSFPENE